MSRQVQHDEILIETQALTRRFGHTLAVDKVNLAVPAGSVYGFLGPNGAGKTTTIRMLLGLIRPSGGQVRLFSLPLAGNRLRILQWVSALVETPSLYPHLTGRENLEVTRRALGLPKSAIDFALQVAGLEKDAKRLVKGYSLGMRQRLALGLALMPEPALLMLDEPTNGLDPAGIIEIRELISSLPGKHGITVFLSSHLLSEVEQVATHIGIIRSGQLIFQGTLQALQAERSHALVVGTDRVEQAAQALQQAGWPVQTRNGRQLKVEVNGQSDAALINRLMVEQGLNVFQLSLEQPTLEETFLQLTGTSRVEAAAPTRAAVTAA